MVRLLSPRSLVAERWRWTPAVVGLIVVWCDIAPAEQPAAKPAASAGVVAVRKQALAVRSKALEAAKQGQPEAALAQCEAFLRQHQKEALYHPEAVAPLCGAAGQVLNGLDDQALRERECQRICRDFADLPCYYAVGAVARLHLFLGPKKDAAGAVTFGREVLTHLTGKLPPTYAGGSVLLCVGRALVRTGEVDAGVALASLAPYVYPDLLKSDTLTLVLYDAARRSRDWEAQLQAAKFGYALCDFSEDALARATERVVEALSAKGGPGAATQFVNAQQSADATNPLKEVPLPLFPEPAALAEKLAQSGDLGKELAPLSTGVGQLVEQLIKRQSPAAEVTDPPTELSLLLRRAGDDLHWRVLVNLAQGDLTTALDDAVDYMREAGANKKNKQQLAQSLADVARVLKATDFNVLRANQFLTYQRTGQGENPVVGF